MTDIRELIDRRPIPVDEVLALIAVICRTASDDANGLEAILLIARMNSIMDEILSEPAKAALLAFGGAGLRALAELTAKYDPWALRVILCAAMGDAPSTADLSYVPDEWAEACGIQISDALRAEAMLLLRELALSSWQGNKGNSLLQLALTQIMIYSNKPEVATRYEFLLDLIFDLRLKLSRHDIEEFEALLDDGPKREEEIQKFLEDHPLLIDIAAVEMISKQRLGVDFVTDFVVKRINNEHVVVEIENSTDPLFTAKGTLTRELLEAISQVEDFISWIYDNQAYAESLMPGMKHPSGLVIIGRRSTLTPVLDTQAFSAKFLSSPIQNSDIR
jgi:Domain of unknown function (DUF4263)